MKQIALIRHGPTDWNAQKRIQGRTDIGLSAEGRRTVACWQLPKRLTGFSAFASPLKRCRQTAEALELSDVQIEPALIEMSWGDFEGQRLAELRERLGEEMSVNEARGLDFRAPGGESPRDVLERFAHWAKGLPIENSLAVTHKGVIRAAVALASGWDMRSKAPFKLNWQHAHIIGVDEDRIEVVELNVPLNPDDRGHDGATG